MKLEGSFSEVLEFANVFEGERYERLKKTLLSTMLRQKDKLFAKGADPDGNQWAPLSKKAMARRMKKVTRNDVNDLKKKDPNFADVKVLQDTGALRNSLTDAAAPYSGARIETDELAVGTSLPYAKIHNYGGIIQHPGTENGFGMGIKIRPYTIDIPARPYIGFGNEDQSQVSEVIEQAMNEVAP